MSDSCKHAHLIYFCSTRSKAAHTVDASHSLEGANKTHGEFDITANCSRPLDAKVPNSQQNPTP